MYEGLSQESVRADRLQVAGDRRGALFGIILLTEAGVWPDPNPNPIGPGLFFFFTFWPSVICPGIGTFRVLRKQ
jgi:hypothetical protein